MGRTYRFVTRDTDRRGNVRLYFRRPGEPKVRLPGPEGSPEFHAAYADALAGRKPAQPSPSRGFGKSDGSFEWLVEAYTRSPAWGRLDEKTRVARRGIMKALVAEYGDLPFAKMTARNCRSIRDRAGSTHGGNNRVKILRALFKFAIEEELAEENPAAEVPMLSTASDGFHSWTLEEVEAFERTYPVGTTARLALAIMLYTGQRRSDAIRLGPQHLHDGWLIFTQHKNRNRKPVKMAIPIMPQLAEIIAATATGPATFIVSERGTPFTDKSFGMRFRRWCDSAGLKHCSAHGLRKATAGRLAELGCSDHEIMAITGHSKSAQVAAYTVGANRRRLAESAMARLSVASVPLIGLAAESETDAAPNPLSVKEISCENGSPGRIRTSDQPVNSRLLYR